MKIRPSNEAREQADLQLHRTLMVMLTGVFLVVLLWLALLLPPPRFEPIVRLPHTTFDQKAPEWECQQTVTIRADGEVFMGDQRVASPGDLEGALRHDPGRRCENKSLRLRVDGSARFGSVRQVIQAAQSVRVTKVTVLARPFDDPAFHDW